MSTFDSILKKTKNYSNIVAVGDVHGKFGELGYRIRELYKITDSIIVLCGDIGMGFHKYNYYVDEFKKLNNIAKKNNNLIFGVRGNHDDPEYFNGTFGFSNIFLVTDYTVLETKENKILFVGGGISIDRIYRTLNKSYWENEFPVYDEEKLKSVGDIDIIITHSAPSFVYPLTKDGIKKWLMYDTNLEKDCNNERLVFDKIYDFLKKQNKPPKYWIYGHYHMSFVEKYETTNFKVVDELEFYQIKTHEYDV